VKQASFWKKGRPAKAAITQPLLRWFEEKARNLRRYAFPAANNKIIEVLRKHPDKQEKETLT